MNHSHELSVRIYTAQRRLGHPGVLLADLLRDLKAGRELAWRLFLRDLSAQYRQTALGYVWVFLPPLAASLTFIFLNAQGIVRIEGTVLPYPAFAMIGTLLWQVFVDALASPSQSLLAAKPMLAKINFPREAILMGGLAMVVFNFLVRLVLVAAVMIWWRIPVGPGLLVFPFAMLGLLITGFAFGLLLAPVGALYGDVVKGIPLLAQFWMLLTPVVYPPRTEGLAGVLATWNPVAPALETAREALTAQPFSTMIPFLVVSLIALVIATAGLITFRLAMPHLIARMGG